jgi:hypothetical protein
MTFVLLADKCEVDVNYLEYSDITAYCREYVLKMGVCAEGAHVDLGILPSALRIESHIIMVPRERSSEVTILHTQLPAINGQKKKIADVHLLFRPGHYDLLYAGKDNDSMLQEFAGLNSSIVGANSVSPAGNTLTSPLTSPQDVLTTHSNAGHSTPTGSSGHVNQAALSQVMNVLSVSVEVGEKILLKCNNNVELATDYYFNNLSQFQSDNSSVSSGSNKSSVGLSSHFSPPSHSTGQHHGHQHPSLASHSPSHPSPDIDERILASAISQYPYIGQPPIRDIIAQVRGFNFPVKVIIDSIVVYHLRSVKDIVDFCNRALNLPGQHLQQQLASSPPVHSHLHDTFLNASADSPAPSIMSTLSDDPSLSSGLGRESDMAHIRREQQQYPELCEAHAYGLVHQLVVGLGYRLHDICTVISAYNCRNVFSVLREMQCQQYRRPNDFTSHNGVVDDDEDFEIVSLVGNAVATMHWDKSEVVDAVVFDYCKSLEDIEDVRKSHFTKQSVRYLQATSRLGDPHSHSLAREERLTLFETRLEGMDRVEMLFYIRKLKISFDEGNDGHLPTPQLRQRLRNGVYAKLERVDML